MEDWVASAIDVLSDEVLQQLCMCLPGRELLHFSVAAKQLHKLTSDSTGIWKRLTEALLGEPLCYLHMTLAGRHEIALDTGFWRSLFRQGRELRLGRWSPELRSAFLDSLKGGSNDNERIGKATVGSGHCSIGLGKLVVKIGGLRPSCNLPYLHAAVFDLEALEVREVELSSNSAKPERRLRHAACEVRPEVTSRRPAVLVLGGCGDVTKEPCAGGLKLLHILELLDDTGSKGRWHSIPAHGQAPGAIWHHICGSFALGQKVIVSGGDIPTSDPEFALISDRSTPAGFVYVLSLDSLQWDRISTSGPAPTWRSLHAGFTHRDVSSHSERLVILGGCAENLRIFGSSDELAPMHGYALDLKRFEWLPQPDSNTLPPARLRLASEKIGDWLLLYGGHGEDQEIGERVKLHKLNLRTLKWGSLDVHGREGSYPAAPAASFSAGLVLGGVRFGPFGISPVPKLDVLTFGAWKPGEADEMQPEEASDEEDEEDNDIIAVVLRDAAGNARRIVVPRAMLALLAGRGFGMTGGDDDAEQSDDPE